MLRKIKDKSGGSAIETVLVVMLVLPLIIMFIVGAFTFFNVLISKRAYDTFEKKKKEENEA